MYLCVCNAISDRQVKAMVQEKGHSLTSVYRELGVRPKCATCVPFIKDAVRQAQAELSALAQAVVPLSQPEAVEAGDGEAVAYGVAAE